MSYTYRDLLRDINKIPEHRLDSTITTSVDPDDTYYILSREEITEEQNMPEVKPETKTKEETRNPEYPELIIQDEGFDLDSVDDILDETSEDEPLVLGPTPDEDDDELLLGPEPDVDSALLVDDIAYMDTSGAAAAALKTPEDWTANDILKELDKLKVKTKIDGFSLKFSPVKNIPQYLHTIINTKKMEIICQIKENQSKDKKEENNNNDVTSLDIEDLFGDEFELELK